MSKKKDEVIPVWDREEEYQSLKAATDAARVRYLEYEGEDEEKKKQLEIEWVKFQKLYEPMYALREEWLRETGLHPKVEQKQKMSKYEKATLGVTVAGFALPTLWEQKGVIWRGAKEWGQRIWGLCTKAMKR